jgi:ferredoxin
MFYLNASLAEPQHFSLAEKLLLVVLTVASGAAFWRRFGVVLDKILKSKPDASFRLFPLGKRVWDFAWEVLFQAKVIRQRPLPGLAHSFVFWGFCAFALVTLNHFAVGLGIGFLSPTGWFGRFYFSLAAAFALACAAGIFGLFVRRFLVRPRWLGKKLSWESGFIAVLIFVLMITYLAAFFVTDASPAARVLWWAHTLAILTFLPLIPHTKHLHLILSPATVFLSRGGFSQIPPLADDEDFGLVAGTDLTRLVSLQAYSCVECGRCTEHCPAANTGKLLNPKEIILGLRGYLNDLGPRSEEPLLGKYNAPEAPFQCTTCGPASSSARWASSTCLSWSDCGAERSTPESGKTTTARNSSWPWNAARTPWECPPPTATNSSKSSSFRLSTGPKSIASGWAAWAATTPRGARLWPTLPA